jgi:hypothetical protein
VQYSSGPLLSFVQAFPACWVPLQKKEWECFIPFPHV